MKFSLFLLAVFGWLPLFIVCLRDEEWCQMIKEEKLKPLNIWNAAWAAAGLLVLILIALVAAIAALIVIGVLWPFRPRLRKSCRETWLDFSTV